MMRIGVLELERDAVALEMDADLDDHAAQRGEGEVGDGMLGSGRHHDHDALAAGEACIAKNSGGLAHLTSQLCEGGRASFEREEHLVGPALGLGVDQLGERQHRNPAQRQ